MKLLRVHVLTVEEQRKTGILENSSIENHSQVVPLTFVEDVRTPDSSATVASAVGLPFANV